MSLRAHVTSPGNLAGCGRSDRLGQILRAQEALRAGLPLGHIDDAPAAVPLARQALALARQTGLDAAPAQISAWGDVADDLALIVDCDASDPGDAAAPPDSTASFEFSRWEKIVLRLRRNLGSSAPAEKFR